MAALNRAGIPPAFEGGFASWNPRFQVPTGPRGQAEPNGVSLGRIGWAVPDSGLVYSARQNATDQQGFVYPRPIVGNQADWRYHYWDNLRHCFVLRGGFECTLARRGDFWARFVGGAYVGQRVYANVLDGTCMAVDRTDVAPDGYEVTPWYVVTEAGAGCLSIISTWSTFT